MVAHRLLISIAMHQGNSSQVNSYVLIYYNYNIIYFINISGAMYYGLPQKEYECYFFYLIGFESPKSAILTCPSIPINRFYGFRSLYIIFFECI
jgi:hypothetical protein